MAPGQYSSMKDKTKSSLMFGALGLLRYALSIRNYSRKRRRAMGVDDDELNDAVLSGAFDTENPNMSSDRSGSADSE
ncbi:hypothetical protein ANCCEY_01234 [Ancylostoma ceylanicum]|uniref:Uncharacterized protein n=1 Tax=Ancylostoma ceylanicum TaxID=53326 RepID=A0A0D6M6D9_9BILA|nr:hypothetical protein ANCCEY_01234 [Ancylostoma ceylanicum]